MPEAAVPVPWFSCRETDREYACGEFRVNNLPVWVMNLFQVIEGRVLRRKEGSKLGTLTLRLRIRDWLVDSDVAVCVGVLSGEVSRRVRRRARRAVVLRAATTALLDVQGMTITCRKRALEHVDIKQTSRSRDGGHEVPKK